MILDVNTQYVIKRWNYENIELEGSRKAIEKRVKIKSVNEGVNELKDEMGKLLKKTLWVYDLMFTLRTDGVTSSKCHKCKRGTNTLVKLTEDSPYSCYICLEQEMIDKHGDPKKVKDIPVDNKDVPVDVTEKKSKKVDTKNEVKLKTGKGKK